MKTPLKIIVIVALAVAVVTALAMKKDRSTSASLNIESTVSGSNTQTAIIGLKTSVTNQVKLPRLLDLGAGKCIPCKMMAPILEELGKEFAGKLIVEFIDVWQNPDGGKQYGVEMIPTQIFFDANGKELFRHTGFFSREDILAKWKEFGVNLTGNIGTVDLKR
jgi:thioredoxin 1